MRLPTLTGEFRVAQDLELRFTQGGKAVLGVALVSSESRKNPHTDEWEDGDRTPFITATLWEQDAEQLVDAGVEKGERVLVTGALFERTYERRDGGEGKSVELKWATVAQVPGGKPRGQGGQRQGGQQQRPQGGQQQRQQGGQDPWSQAAGRDDPWAPPAGNDEPPF